MLIIPERLKELRISKGVTQKQVAEYLGVQNVTLQRFEYGDRRPGIETLIALADYFDVSLDYLVGRSDDPGNQKNAGSKHITHKELAQFSYGDLAKMQITHQDLSSLTVEELMEIAKQELEVFQEAPDSRNTPYRAIKPFVISIVSGILSSCAYDMMKSIDWKSILTGVIFLLTQLNQPSS